jgi:uncharacterized protein YukE
MVMRRGVAVDGLMDRRLRDQEQSLRAVMCAWVQVSSRVAGLGSGAGWLGPASSAYDAAVGALRLEASAVEAYLEAALDDTIRAISTPFADTGAEESRG